MLDKIKISIYKSKISKKVEEILGFDSKVSKDFVEEVYSLFEKIVSVYAKENNMTQDTARKKIMELLQEDQDIKELLEK